MAQRIQLRRTKGWRKPEGAVVVARPSVWGNPWRIRDGGRAYAVNMFRSQLGPCIYSDNDGGARLGLTWPYPPIESVIRQHLRGRDLACWCSLDQPCHADVLLEIANA